MSGKTSWKGTQLAPVFGVIAILTLQGCSSLMGTVSGGPPGDRHRPPETEVTLDGLTGTPPLRISDDGLTQNTVRLTDKDENIILNIARGTKLLDSQSNTLRVVSRNTNTSYHPLPPTTSAVMSYEIGPDGARCLPAARLTLKYDPSVLCGEIREDRLFIAFWDGREWQSLVSVVDMEENMVSTRIDHFGYFALVTTTGDGSYQRTAALGQLTRTRQQSVIVGIIGSGIIAGLLLFFTLRRYVTQD